MESNPSRCPSFCVEMSRNDLGFFFFSFCCWLGRKKIAEGVRLWCGPCGLRQEVRGSRKTSKAETSKAERLPLENFAEMDRYAAALSAKFSPECMCLQDVSDGHTRQGFADGRVKKTRTTN